MKQALLGALLIGATVGGTAQKMVVAEPRLNVPSIPMHLTPADLVPQVSSKEADGTQATTFKKLFTTDVRSQFHYWPFGVASNDIFKYEAKTNTLNIARNKAVLAGQSLGGVDIGIMRSTNNGTAWTFDIVKSSTEIFFGMPNLGWVNPDESTDPMKLPLTIFGIRYPMPQLSYGGMSLWNRTTAGAYEMVLNDQDKPAPGYDVQFGDLYSDNSSGAIHYAGMLNPGDGTQYGAYGYFNFNLVVEDFGTYPTIPSQWALDKFRPSESVSSSYNAPMLIDGDKSGGVYAVFNNFAADNLDVRAVQVTKSVDQGKKWGEFNTMPANLMDEFAATNGGDIAFQPGQSPYQGGTFIVTGEDSYSYFTRVVTGLKNKDNPGQIDSILAYHIVECAYNKGTWKMRAVAPLASFGIKMVSIQDSISQAVGAPAIVLSDNGRGHEIQAAKTADGTTLVVKFIEINPGKENTFTGVRVFEQVSAGQYNEVDPVAKNFDTDVFIATRALSSENWSDAVNCTNDADMAFRTYMPDVVPSLTKIPLLRMLGTNAGSISSLLPKPLYQTMWNGTASIEFASINLETVGVKEEASYAFRLGNIAPNPVSNSAEVTFTLDRPATVALEVFDMVGNNLGTVYTQNLNQGLHGVTVDASTFATGSYNLALVVDGVRTTKPFVVIR